MPSEERPGLQVAGGMTMGCGFVLIAGAIALVASVFAVKVECPPESVACPEGQGLAVFVATPVVFGGIVLATIGWFMLVAARRKR